MWLITVNTTTADTSTPFDFSGAMRFGQIDVSWQYSIGTKERQERGSTSDRVGDLVQQIDHPGQQGRDLHPVRRLTSGATPVPGPWSCYLYVVDLTFDGLDDMAAKLSGKSGGLAGYAQPSHSPRPS